MIPVITLHSASWHSFPHPLQFIYTQNLCPSIPLSVSKCHLHTQHIAQTIFGFSFLLYKLICRPFPNKQTFYMLEVTRWKKLNRQMQYLFYWVHIVRKDWNIHMLIIFSSMKYSFIQYIFSPPRSFLKILCMAL